MQNLLDRITIDDEVCNGRPIIRGYRLTVQTVLEFILAGTSDEELFAAYPFLEKDDIEACKQFAVRLMDRHFTIHRLAA
ncbi:MAG: DUF433 domain-containing protein [Spirosoma sp.]|nr:DUF433 domain-containing protein [Spirosoma sp.]